MATLGLLDNGLEFTLQGLLATTEFGRSLPQLVNGDQLLLTGRDQAVDTRADTSQTGLKVALALCVGISIPSCRQATVKLGADQGRVLKQPHHFTPDKFIKIVQLHQPIVAQRALETPPGLGCQTAILAFPAGRRAG